MTDVVGGEVIIVTAVSVAREAQPPRYVLHTVDGRAISFAIGTVPPRDRMIQALADYLAKPDAVAVAAMLTKVGHSFVLAKPPGDRPRVEQDPTSGRWYVLDHQGQRLHGPYLDHPERTSTK